MALEANCSPAFTTPKIRQQQLLCFYKDEQPLLMTLTPCLHEQQKSDRFLCSCKQGVSPLFQYLFLAKHFLHYETCQLTGYGQQVLPVYTTTQKRWLQVLSKLVTSSINLEQANLLSLVITRGLYYKTFYGRNLRIFIISQRE